MNDTETLNDTIDVVLRFPKLPEHLQKNWPATRAWLETKAVNAAAFDTYTLGENQVVEACFRRVEDAGEYMRTLQNLGLVSKERTTLHRKGQL